MKVKQRDGTSKKFIIEVKSKSQQRSTHQKILREEQDDGYLRFIHMQ